MKTQDGELFRFRLLTEIRFGCGIRKKILEYLDELKVSKIALIVDPHAAKLPRVSELVDKIATYIPTQIHNKLPGEPEMTELHGCRENARAFGAEAVIGLGGGSTLDLAKALAAVLPNEKPVEDYQGFDLLEKPALPSLLIPTLFGSGAELTASAVMINRKLNKKGGINGRYVFPRMAVVDPELGIGTPLNIMGGTALDALVHAIEGYVATCATPHSRLYSKAAVNKLIPSLNTMIENPESPEMFEDLAYGALLAITGLMHSEAGLCGAASYPLGVYHQVPHGLAGGVLMPFAIRYNSKNGCHLYDELTSDIYTENGAEQLAAQIETFLKAIQAPRLSAFGLTENDVKTVSQHVYSFKQILGYNPVKIDSENVIEEMIMSAY